MPHLALRDLICRDCGEVYHDVYCEYQKYGICGICNGPVESAASWNGANGGLYGSPTQSDASGQSHSSQYEKEKYMASKGFGACGDKVHGARLDLSMKKSAFSFSGQKSRVSTGESNARR